MADRNGSRGAIMIIVMIMILVIAGFSAALMHMQTAHAFAVSRSVAEENALQTAETGVDRVLAGLFQNYDGADNDGDGLMDEGKDGLDNDGDTLVDELDEFEFQGRLGTAAWNPAADDTGGVVPGAHSSGNRTGAGNGRPNIAEPNVTPLPWGPGSYVTWLTHNGFDGADNDGDGAVDEADERGLGTLRSEAQVQGTVVSLETVASLVPATTGAPPGSPQSPIFGNGAFGDAIVAMDSNAFVDSYKSSLGTYASQANTMFRGSRYARAGGHTGSNGTITLDSNTKIFGNASVASGGTIRNNGYISGTQTTSAARAAMPAIQLPSFATAPASTLNVGSNSTATITSGNYHYSSLTTDSNSTLTVQGPATIVVDHFNTDSNSRMVIDATNGPVTFIGTGWFRLDSNASVSSTTQRPADFTALITTDNIANPTLLVKVGSNSGLYGRVYAPNAQLIMDSNGGLFGQAIAKDLHIDSNAVVHFDEDLLNSPVPFISPPPGGPSHFPVVSWKWERVR